MAKLPTTQQVIKETEAVFGYMKGSAKWAKVLTVDDYGKFSINIYPDATTLAKYTEEFEEVVQKAKDEVEASGKKVAGMADVYKEDNEGKKFFSFKLPELNYEGNPNKIDIYDVYGKKVEDWDKLIGNGSIVKVKFMAKPYYMNSTKMVGLSYKFYAVQVIDLQEYGGADAGFGDETSEDAPFDTDTNEDF